jgi:hypothetical protein
MIKDMLFHLIDDEVTATSNLKNGKKILKKNFAQNIDLFTGLDDNPFLTYFKIAKVCIDTATTAVH